MFSTHKSILGSEGSLLMNYMATTIVRIFCSMRVLLLLVQVRVRYTVYYY
jgi:hypothetical protein